MLPASLRMRRSADFRQTIRLGARAGRATVVVHCRETDGPGRQVGFVVARTVGNAVVRNKVRRRLRGVVIELAGTLPDGVAVVVRALPASAEAGYDALRDDVRSGLTSALRKAARRGPASPDGSR